MKRETAMVEPRSVLDRSRRRAHGSSTPTASQPKLITALRYSAPSHVQTASVPDYAVAPGIPWYWQIIFYAPAFWSFVNIWPDDGLFRPKL